MGQGMSTSFPHSTSNSQGNRSFAFDYDYYASDNKTSQLNGSVLVMVLIHLVLILPLHQFSSIIMFILRTHPLD